MNRLTVRVQPKSSRNDIRVDEGVVKVWVSAPPVEGEANQAVGHLLAKRLGIKPSSVSLVSGQTSRTKVFDLGDLDPAQALLRLSQQS